MSTTIAAQAVLDYGFGALQILRLICSIYHDNRASIRVAEKIGMTFDKESIDDNGPFLLYARSRTKNI